MPRMSKYAVRGIRLAIVENDPFAMEFIVRLLRQYMPSIAVAKQITGGAAAIDFFETHDYAADILLLDMHLGDIDGPRVAWQIRRVNSTMPILAVTSLPLKQYRSAAAQAGVQGLLPKKDIVGIARAIQQLNKGAVCEGFETPAMASRRIEKQFQPLMVLTPTQTRVIEMIALGASDEEIAKALHCASATVRKHRQNILQRLGVSTMMEGVKQWQRWNRMLGLD